MVKVAGKLPQFRDIHSVQSAILRICRPRDCGRCARRGDGCAGLPTYTTSQPSDPGPWEVCRGFSSVDRRVINRSTGNWARSVVTTVIPPAQRCANFGLRDYVALWTLPVTGRSLKYRAFFFIFYLFYRTCVYSRRKSALSRIEIIATTKNDSISLSRTSISSSAE